LKRILITGGSRGLGLAICRSLAQAGYTVVTVSRHGSPELTQAISEFQGRIEQHRADLTETENIPKLCHDLHGTEGFDGFVANAAMATEGLLALTAAAEIEKCIQLNLLSVVLLSREILKGMLQRGGSLVFIASITAIRGYSGLSVYSATKGALLSFSRSLAREYGPRKIRSNCVLPGFLETEMTQTLSAKDKERIARRTALQRLGQPSDVVGTVKFLLSDEAQFVTGAEFIADGGLTA
jgi:3-oxoacyl-[acyl-carrier protein] reductase